MPTPRLSVVIPVYNEVGTICQLLDKVAACRLDIPKEIIVVNDGSKDESPQLIQDWIETRTLHGEDTITLYNQANGGKGSAVRAGIERSTGDVLIIQDADLEYDPVDYAACIAPILSGKAHVVYGSRELRRQHKRHSSVMFYAGGKLVTVWMNLLFFSHMTDEPTCYKTFDGPLIRAMSFETDGFEWEPEITARLLRLGYDIAEVPIHYYPRATTEGKKIKWTDGVTALRVALAWRFRSLAPDRARLAAAGIVPPR